MSFNWFHNRIPSCFKCFDHDLNTINSLLMFYNKEQERKTDLSFSKSFQAIEFSLWALVIQKRSVIRILCIDFSWFCNSVIRSKELCTFWCCKAKKGCVLLRLSRSTFLVCVLSQRKCVSWGDQCHFFGGVYVIWIWLPSGFPSCFWETRCSSWFKSEPV